MIVSVHRHIDSRKKIEKKPQSTADKIWQVYKIQYKIAADSEALFTYLLRDFKIFSRSLKLCRCLDKM